MRVGFSTWVGEIIDTLVAEAFDELVFLHTSEVASNFLIVGNVIVLGGDIEPGFDVGWVSALFGSTGAFEVSLDCLIS